MAHQTLSDRVAALEQEVARLMKLQPGEKPAPERDWRSTVGMFRGDSIMKEVIEEGRKIRVHDREQSKE